MAGDPETGVTTMQMDAGLDTGDILLQAALPLTDDDDLGTLEPKLSEIGAGLLLETLTRLEQGNCPRIPQDEAAVTLSPSLPPDIGALDWRCPARDLHNLVRGVTPRPGAFSIWQGKRLKVWKTEVIETAPPGEPGLISGVDTQGIIVSTGKGALRLREVQPESKARMTADAWARGARVSIGGRFEPAPHSER
jgi:methionyl-tRNA formyltransferase